LGVFAFLVVVGTIAGFLIWKRRRTIRFKQPTYNAIVFGKAPDLMYDVKTPYNDLQTLQELLVANDMILPLAISSSCEVTEKENMSKSLMHWFVGQQKAVSLLQKFMDFEVERCTDQNTLLRSNSITSSCFQVFAKVVGIRYLWETLGPFLAELNAATQVKRTPTNSSSSIKRSLFDEPLEMEIDPNKLGSDDDASGTLNKYKLLLTTQKFFQQIIGSRDLVPQEIRTVLNHTAESVVKKFPSGKYKAIGGLFFLRFIVPAITTPHIYGLLPVPPNEPVQRNLVLLAKVLQNLANSATFGAKEAHMAKLNDFVEENTSIMYKFFDTLATSTVVEESNPKVPTVVNENALYYIHKYLYEHQKPVQDALDKAGQQDLAKKLQEFLESTPPNAQAQV